MEKTSLDRTKHGGNTRLDLVDGRDKLYIPLIPTKRAGIPVHMIGIHRNNKRYASVYFFKLLFIRNIYEIFETALKLNARF